MGGENFVFNKSLINGYVKRGLKTTLENFFEHVCVIERSLVEISDVGDGILVTVKQCGVVNVKICTDTYDPYFYTKYPEKVYLSDLNANFKTGEVLELLQKASDSLGDIN